MSTYFSGSGKVTGGRVMACVITFAGAYKAYKKVKGEKSL